MTIGDKIPKPHFSTNQLSIPDVTWKGIIFLNVLHNSKADKMVFKQR